MRGMGDAPPTRSEESTEFWARQFAGRWYRGPAHSTNDFRRFSAAYRVPAVARGEVQARARALLARDVERRTAQGG
jgi:hypothetical protein